MSANAQRDGLPDEHRWRPLFNAAVWLTPTTRCRAVTLPRPESHWNLQGCPKLANRSQPLVGQSSPYYVEEVSVFKSVTEDTVKYFSRMSCKLAHSTNMCFSVSGIPQDWQVGGSSPQNKYEWVRREWPIWSLLSRMESQREIFLLCLTIGPVSK